jgi:sugar/nucleoside kinase (ribokinase family)
MTEQGSHLLQDGQSLQPDLFRWPGCMTQQDIATIPDYLVIGTITKDLVPEGFTIGGTVTYGAITASRLGKQAGIVTSAAADLDLPCAFGGIQCVRVLAQHTTTFRNVYLDGTRKQYIQAVCEKIKPEHIPLVWRQAPLVHLAPLAGEIEESLVHVFPASRVIATPQGWFRSWDETGFVSLGAWRRAPQLLPYLTALILSDEDVHGDPACIERFAAITRTLVVTNGARGATVHHLGQVRRIPPRPAREVDPTGAGDVFAAAFLIRLRETVLTTGTEDPWEAARFANVVASFSVEGPGFTAIPRRAQVEAYLTKLPTTLPLSA